MKPTIALVWRELLEHRGAFLIAPTVLLASLFVMLVLGITFGETQIAAIGVHIPGAIGIYSMGLGVVFAVWTVYFMVALFFYYADSFSADRRNNSLLFWKSMPRTDLQVLGSKALAGVTIFPLLMFGFALITGILVYALEFIAVVKVPFLPVISPFDMLSAWLQMAPAGAVFMLLSVLWAAPMLAWVAGLSTLVQRWSIPLAFLIPGAVVLVERLMTITKPDAARPIANYLAYRASGPMGDVDFVRVLASDTTTRFELTGRMLAAMNWQQTGLGLIFAVLVVYLASEYRRRRIEA